MCQKNNNKISHPPINKCSFTLIELLVVIAIIALLMAILMPALSKIKRECKSILCRSKLRDWGFYYYLYTNDNNGYFANTEERPLSRITWVMPERPYYKDDPRKLLCPVANKPAYPNPGIIKPMGSKFKAWGRWITPYDENNSYGSYGINCWVYNQTTRKSWHVHPTKLNWRTVNNIKGAIKNNIPLLLDCAWVGGCPHDDDKAPAYDDEICIALTGQDSMKRFCIDRHGGYINGTFLDFSVRKIGLKELWRLKWNREFHTDTTQNWPDWMRKFRDY